jgi:hypothetical protein
MKMLRMAAITINQKPKKKKNPLPKGNSPTSGRGKKKRITQKDAAIVIQGDVEKSNIIDGDGNVIGSQNQVVIIKGK